MAPSLPFELLVFVPGAAVDPVQRAQLLSKGWRVSSARSPLCRADSPVSSLRRCSLSVTLSLWLWLLLSKMTRPSPVHLPPCVKFLSFFNMDQEMVSSVMGLFMLACKSLTDICIELLLSRTQGVLIRISCHWHLLSVTKEQADITEFPIQRWEKWGRGRWSKLSSCGCKADELQNPWWNILSSSFFQLGHSIYHHSKHHNNTCAKLLHSCLTLCDPVDCSPPASSVHGILQARVLERVAMPSSRNNIK